MSFVSQELVRDFGYKALWIGVLMRAIADAECGSNWNDYSYYSHSKYRENAITWFRSESRDVCSFLWVCDLLGLSAGRVRKMVLG